MIKNKDWGVPVYKIGIDGPLYDIFHFLPFEKIIQMYFGIKNRMFFKIIHWLFEHGEFNLDMDDSDAIKRLNRNRLLSVLKNKKIHNNALRRVSSLPIDLSELFLERCKNNDIELVEILLTDDRWRISIRPHKKFECFPNEFPIGYASQNGHIEIVKLLLSDPRVDPSDDRNYSNVWASENGHIGVVKLLLDDPRIDPSDLRNHAIRVASRNGHTDIVKLLLDDGRADPSYYVNFAIRWASRNGHSKVVKLLLNDPRVDPSVQNNYAIRMASLNGHLDVVKLLLADDRVDPSDKDNEAIKLASGNRHTDVVNLLLAHQNDVNNEAIRLESQKPLKFY